MQESAASEQPSCFSSESVEIGPGLQASTSPPVYIQHCMYSSGPMARRSKEDALATRHALLDAAEHVFLAQGVAGTSLNDIAQAAGTTRGAIYWHFKDKADLFNAMMDRVAMPLQCALSLVDEEAGDDPLPGLKKSIRAAMRQTVHDPQTRRVFEVATHMVEYVDSLCAVRERHREVRDLWTARFRHVLLRSAQARGVKLSVPATVAAHGLHGLLDGLLQNWLLDPGAFELESCASRAVDAYLRGIGLE
jgi:TetR/AcrR family acrAB operon transcriptional repressor